jgi:hypothetical protein
MSQFYAPTPEQRLALEQLAEQVADVQRTLVANHPRLHSPDRAAHQQQLAGGKVFLTVDAQLPTELDGLGLFQRGSGPHVGIGRMSTGLGCPHAETEPDFLGLLAAFRTGDGRRVDFVALNHGGAPTDTPEEFIALLKATADAAGAEHSSDLLNLVSTQAKLFAGLVKHAGTRAPAIGAHVVLQTSRTTHSSSAYQPYWTGVVRARDVLGKFTFVPTHDVNAQRPASAGRHYLSVDWRDRQAATALEFRLYWIPFLNEHETPLENLTKEWAEQHKVPVGTVTFPVAAPDAMDTKLQALLAAEMGANQGNWIEDDRGSSSSDLPATEFTAARFLAYRVSQRLRNALSDDAYASFFDKGEITPALAAELVRRYQQKRAAGHDVPDVGEVGVS